MTFAGKILVIVIMAMSLVFLGVSTVALTTSTDWKKAIGDQNKANQDIQTDLTRVEGERDAFKAKLDLAQKERAAATKAIEAQIVALTTEAKQGRDTLAKSDATLLQHQTDAKNALEDVKNKNADIIKLREEVAAVTEQANKFRARQEEYDSEIASLRRMLDAAKTNASQINQSR
jgi:chromosome segregation ATPase